MPFLHLPRRSLISAVLLPLTISIAWAQSPQPMRTILVVGDSLSAAYGMAVHEGWVALLGEQVKREFSDWQVVNASISGDTSAGGAARIARDIAHHQPTIVVIELGGNDGLRGLPLDGENSLKHNLAAMIETAQRANAHVLLLGIELPPNLGADYTRRFARLYPELAEHYHTALLPSLLAPIATERDAFQHDQIHPIATVQPRLLKHVWPALRPLIGCAASTPASECK